MREIAKGTNCTLRISVSDVGKIQNAKKIDTHIVSPSGVVSCVDNAYDELMQEVVVSIDGALFNEVGPYSVNMRIVYDDETVVVPTIAFAEVVDSNESECEDYAVIGIEVKGGNVTPSEGEVVELVERKEFDALEGRVEDLEQRGGGGNTDNNYTDEDKALVQTIPDKVGRSEFEDTLQEMNNSYGEIHGNLYQEIETKANKKGYYPSMSVGMADNLVGRGDVQDAHINFRPSAGVDNITDGAARIERIKGNSAVYNQLITNSRFETKTNYNVTGGATLNVDGGIATITLGASNYSGITNVELHSKLLVGHKYLFVTEAKADAEMQNVLIPYVLSAFVSPKNIVSTEWRSYSFIQEATSATMAYGVARASTYGTDFQGGEKIYAKSFRVIDLTKEFGVGNEPTTVEEYLQRKPMNIEDEFEYNDGELIDMKVDSLISTSDNAYDYTKHYARVMGGYKYDITANAGATLVVSFYADGEDSGEEREIAPDSEGKYTFPANGICHVNGDFANESNVCVCLNHSYDKPHPAYQQEVRDLSFINDAFPNGMRSAGSAFDEIRFNPTTKKWEKIVRVGVRAYAEGDAEDSSVTTDGKTTNYPLDNPTPTTIDLSPNFNLDYLVWDFGTEEAIASVPSAPFRADINYEPNAVDDIRWAVSEIRKLKAQIAQMQTSVTNLNE